MSNDTSNPLLPTTPAPATSVVSNLLPTNMSNSMSPNLQAQAVPVGDMAPINPIPPVPVPPQGEQTVTIAQGVPMSVSLPGDPLSGAMLTQLSQNAQTAPGTPQLGGAPFVGSSSKESLAGGLPTPAEIPLSALQKTSVEGQNTTPEVSAAARPVEVAPAKELEPEVEATQEKIAAQKINTLQETVVAADTMPTIQPVTVSQPVVVLPLSEKGMQDGQKKSTQYSVRWLYEWCVRQIRKFSETLVVYRDKDEG